MGRSRSGGAKQRALLALLLLNANRVVARERLIDELWGDEPPETAVTTVQVYVSRLRKLLPEGVSSDAAARLPARGRAGRARPRCASSGWSRRRATRTRSTPRSSCARRSSSGAGRRWPSSRASRSRAWKRGRLEELRLAALEERIEADLALGRHAELVGELEALIAEHPHRERLRGAADAGALPLGPAGGGARGLPRRARAALDELGIEPSADAASSSSGRCSRRTRRSISRRSACVADGRSAPRAARARVAVSRSSAARASWRALHALLERAEGGEGGLVLLDRRAGRGQDAARARARARGGGARACSSATASRTRLSARPYQPLREWLEFLLRVCEPEALAECSRREGGQLARLVPELAR